jgi:hypothetical protein
MDRDVTLKGERRGHARSWFLLGHAKVAARLRTGSPLRVINVSPDGMLVESPARLLPGRQVDLVLQTGVTREQAPWVVVHSRVGCLRGSSELRYRAGLRRARGTNYSADSQPQNRGHELPTGRNSDRQAPAENQGETHNAPDGIRFGRLERA